MQTTKDMKSKIYLLSNINYTQHNSLLKEIFVHEFEEKKPSKWIKQIKKYMVPILAASDLIQALTLIIASFGFYSDLFITFDRSNWRRIIRDAMDGTHPKVL